MKRIFPLLMTGVLFLGMGLGGCNNAEKIAKITNKATTTITSTTEKPAALSDRHSRALMSGNYQYSYKVEAEGVTYTGTLAVKNRNAAFVIEGKGNKTRTLFIDDKILMIDETNNTVKDKTAAGGRIDLPKYAESLKLEDTKTEGDECQERYSYTREDGKPATITFFFQKGKLTHFAVAFADKNNKAEVLDWRFGADDALFVVPNFKKNPQYHSLDAIKQRGVLVIGSELDCWGIFKDKAGEIRGMNAEFIKAFAKHIGVKLEFAKKNSINEVLNAVETGDVDIAISVFARTPERIQRFSVSDNYFFKDYTEDYISINTENAAKLNLDTKEGLSKANIAVISGTVQETTAKKTFPQAKIFSFENEQKCFEAMTTKKVDAWILSSGAFAKTDKAYLAAVEKKLIKISDFVITENSNEQCYIMMKGTPGLPEAINAFIAENKNKGNFEKWYKENEGLFVELGY